MTWPSLKSVLLYQIANHFYLQFFVGALYEILRWNDREKTEIWEAKYNQHIQFPGRLLEWDGLSNIERQSSNEPNYRNCHNASDLHSTDECKMQVFVPTYFNTIETNKTKLFSRLTFG